MAIDVLSDDADSAPIIVGDSADMSNIEAVGSDDVGRFHLVMLGHKVDLSETASKNFHSAKHLLLVEVEGDQVARARKVRIDNIEDGSELNEDQCRALGEALSLDDGRDFRTAKLNEFRCNYPELAAA